MSRTIKQIIYGFFYLAILAGVVYGGFLVAKETAPSCFDNRRNQQEEETDCGGPCMSCAIKRLQPISPKLEYFGVGENTSVILTLSNPNIDYGAQSFIYTINFYGSGGAKLFSLSKDSFIYPAEAQKTIIEPNLRFNYGAIVGQPEIVISSLNWKPITEFFEPQFQTRQIRTEVTGSTATVTGILVNRESISFPKATVGVLVYQQVLDGQNRLVGASKTVLQTLKPFEERAFKILVPLDAPFKLPEIETLITTEVQR